MSDSAALDSFLEKWRARWPEWSVAEVFVAPARRDIVVAWFALLQEFEDVLNIAGDPLPADAKLAWWGEELRGWASQRSRHPLGRRLEPVRADWARLADAFEQFDIVVAVRIEKALVEIEAIFGGEFLGGKHLAFAETERADDLAGEHAVFDFIGRTFDIVDAEVARGRFDLIDGR